MKFKEYINTEFTDAVIEFNYATGSEHDNQSLDEIIESINLQANIVREELIETITAWGDDEIETLDGIADIWYTIVNLNQKMNKIKLDDEDYAEGKVNLKKIEMLSVLIEALLEDLDSGFNDEQLIAACKLVVDNNKLKYTKDINEFNSWKYDADKLSKRETIYGGETFYSLVNEDGKVSKHDNFKKVCLKDIVNLDSGEVKDDKQES